MGNIVHHTFEVQHLLLSILVQFACVCVGDALRTFLYALKLVAEGVLRVGDGRGVVALSHAVLVPVFRQPRVKPGLKSILGNHARLPTIRNHRAEPVILFVGKRSIIAAFISDGVGLWLSITFTYSVNGIVK